MTTLKTERPNRLAMEGLRIGPAKCIHPDCRCIRAGELAAMGRTVDATRVHYERVPCRRLPGIEK